MIFLITHKMINFKIWQYPIVEISFSKNVFWSSETIYRKSKEYEMNQKKHQSYDIERSAAIFEL